MTLADAAAWRVGITLTLLVVAAPVVAAAGWIAGLPTTPWPLVGVGIGTAVWVARDRDTRQRAMWMLVAILAVSFAIAANTWDVTYDGQTYQQAAARALADGWNPVWAPEPPSGTTGEVYVSALPKAAWALNAMLYQLTGRLEAAKAVHLIALCAAFLLARGALLTAGVRPRAATIVAALAAGNPVATTQLLSFHLDGLVASAVVIVGALMVKFVRAPDRPSSIALVLAVAFLANLKFPGAMYAALLAVGGFAYAIVRDRGLLRRAFVVGGLAVAMAAVQGISPYVTNTVRHGHPAWPAAGRNAMRLVVHFDTAFASQPRVVQYVRGLLARSNDRDEEPPRLKVPLTVHAAEIRSLGTADTRIGGLGPLFGGAALISLALSLFSAARKRPRAALLAAITFAIVLSGLAVPFGYYSRYAPQVWLVALPVLLTDELRGWMTRLLAALLTANALLVAAVSLGTQLFLGILQREQLRDVAGAAAGGRVTWNPGDRPFTNVDLRITASGAEPVRVDTLRCPAPATIVTTHALVCIGVDGSPPPAPDPERRARAILRRLPR